MQKVPIHLATPGMVLAKAILNDKGMPLCAEGTELTEMLIDRLRAMNFTMLMVKGHPLGEDAPAKTTEETVQDVEERFIRVKGDPLMDRIRDAIVSAVRQEAAERQSIDDNERAST